MNLKHVDDVRKALYKTLASFRGKDYTGAEVRLGLWEATSMDFLHSILKGGFKIVSPSGIDMDIEALEIVVDEMESKPDCFGSKKVRVKKGVPRFDCVVCVWELPCMERYEEKRKARKPKKKKRDRKK